MKMELLQRKHVREAKHWISVGNNIVECRLCYRRCRIAAGRFGVCGVRKNISGRLYSLVYGLLTAANIDPIEKKPLYHFKPSSRVLSISTVGCNFFCSFCQNYEISQFRLEKGLYGKYYSPEEIVEAALYYKADGFSYTYNEPIVFYEYMYDTANLAGKRGLFNTMVTNGYLELDAAEELSRVMNAATVDFKGGANKDFYRKYMGVQDPEPIFQTVELLYEKGVFIEITNLVIPKLGDKAEDVKKLSKWIAERLSPEVPLHLLRFHPDYKMLHVPPTPVETLEELARVARDEGLQYVYLGNVWGHKLENTYCPHCGSIAIRRYGFYVEEVNLDKTARCKKCGHKLNIKL